jgi:hypothetical protein
MDAMSRADPSVDHHAAPAKTVSIPTVATVVRRWSTCKAERGVSSRTPGAVALVIVSLGLSPTTI